MISKTLLHKHQPKQRQARARLQRLDEVNIITTIKSEASPLANKTYLRVVPEPAEGQALILQFTTSPQLRGKDVAASIACGTCKKLLAKDMTTQSLSESLSGGETTLVILCPCGAYNAWPA